MPFTPFHFGPGIAIKAVLPLRFSLSAYAASQVVIDIESGYHLFSGHFPVHRELHTFALGAPVGAVVGTVTAMALAHLSRLASDPRPAWRAEALVVPGVVGGLFGGIMHSVLDGIMHADIWPLRPFTTANPLYQLISSQALHWVCALAGLLGVLVLTAARRRQAAE